MFLAKLIKICDNFLLPQLVSVFKSRFASSLDNKNIDVYEAEGKGKNKMQRIVIYYRFVGYIELPDKIPIVNDTRQEVAVN